MNKGKYLGVDFGDKRVGIAISDFNKEIAFPRSFLTFKNIPDLIGQIKILCEQESIVKIIVGLPLQMDGTFGDRAQRTQQFGEKLQEVLSEIPVEYFDERLTSVEAEGVLRQQGYKSHQQKDKKDAIAAQKILEAYLNQLKRG